jgi:hypothetical protein
VLTRKAVKPDSAIATFPSTLALFALLAFDPKAVQLVPLPEQGSHILSHMGLKLENALLGEYVGNDFAFASMGYAITRIEDTAPNRHESIVKVGLERAVAMGVDDLQGRRVRDGDMIWCETNEGACIWC